MLDNKRVTQESSIISDVDIATKPSQEKKDPVAELLFLSFVSIAIVIAFVLAMGYHPVSARAPLVVMTPLIILLVVHGINLLRNLDRKFLENFYEGIIKGKNSKQKRIYKFVLWMTVFTILIFVVGHYIACTLFMFILLFFFGKEKLKLSLIMSIVATTVLYFLFEKGFSIELYRGLIFRYFMGYDIL